MKNFFSPSKTDERVRAFVRAAASPALSSAQKAKTRTFLHAYARMRPARAFRETRTRFSWRIHFFQVVAAVLVIVIATGGSAAAESALPGDFLYPVKVAVNEEVRAILTVSPKARADFAIERAERRMEEVAALALSGSLGEAESERIATQIERHVEEAEVNSAKIAQAEAPRADREIEVNLNAALAAHAEILDGVAAELDDEVRDRVNRVAKRARGQVFADAARRGGAAAPPPIALMALSVEDIAMDEGEVEADRVHEERRVHEEKSARAAESGGMETTPFATTAAPEKAPEVSEEQTRAAPAEAPDDEERVREWRSVADERIKSSDTLIEKRGTRIVESVRTHVETRLARAKQTFADAENAYQSGHPREAKEKFRDAVREAIGARAFLSARANNAGVRETGGREEKKKDTPARAASTTSPITQIGTTTATSTETHPSEERGLDDRTDDDAEKSREH